MRLIPFIRCKHQFDIQSLDEIHLQRVYGESRLSLFSTFYHSVFGALLLNVAMIRLFDRYFHCIGQLSTFCNQENGFVGCR